MTTRSPVPIQIIRSGRRAGLPLACLTAGVYWWYHIPKTGILLELSMDDSQPSLNVKSMKKAKASTNNGLRSEYKRSDFPGGMVRGKYAARFAAGTNIVRLDPEIAAAFPTSAAVNEALGTVLKAARSARLSKRTMPQR